MTTSGLQVVLADDDVLLREGLASLMERSRFQVVGQAGDAAQLLALVADQRPDLAVIDIRMPPTHTTEGLTRRQIRQEHLETAILVLSAHVEVEHAMELLASGRGVGYLLKSRVTDIEEFIDTLERIANGGSVVDPARAGAGGRAPPQRPAGRPQRAGARGAGPDGRGPLERRHRPPAMGHRGHRRKARTQHPHQADAPETADDHRRVLAVLTFLDAR